MVCNLVRGPARGAALALAGGLLLSGCGSEPDDSGDHGAHVSTPGPDAGRSSSSGPLALVDDRGLLAAGTTVQATVAGSTVVSIETERQAGHQGWEVQVVTADGVEHEAVTSLDGAAILTGPRRESDDSEDRAKHLKRVAAATLDHRGAAAAVRKVAPGQITELNLDDHRGGTVWEADVVSDGKPKVEVKIDARTGRLVARSTDGG